MTFRSFLSTAVAAVALGVVSVGAPASAQQPAYGPNNVRVCVEERGEATCYNVSSNNPDLLMLTKRNKPELNNVYIPLLSDLYESGILFIGSLLFLLVASSCAASWMILNWKKIRPTNPQ